MQEAAESREDTKTGPQATDNKIAEDNNDQQNAVQSKDDSSMDDAMTAAYGKKETEIGKLIRLTA